MNDAENCAEIIHKKWTVKANLPVKNDFLTLSMLVLDKKNSNSNNFFVLNAA